MRIQKIVQLYDGDHERERSLGLYRRYDSSVPYGMIANLLTPLSSVVSAAALPLFSLLLLGSFGRILLQHYHHDKLRANPNNNINETTRVVFLSFWNPRSFGIAVRSLDLCSYRLEARIYDVTFTFICPLAPSWQLTFSSLWSIGSR